MYCHRDCRFRALFQRNPEILKITTDALFYDAHEAISYPWQILSGYRNIVLSHIPNEVKSQSQYLLIQYHNIDYI